VLMGINLAGRRPSLNSSQWAGAIAIAVAGIGPSLMWGGGHIAGVPEVFSIDRWK